MKKRILSLILAVLMLFTFNIGANAETAVQPRYSYTNSNDAIISLTGDQLTCSVEVVGKKDVTTRIIITMTLQKKGLFTWSNVTSWNTDIYDYEAGITKRYGPVDSGTYRVKLQATVYSGSASETVSDTSASVKVS